MNLYLLANHIKPVLSQNAQHRQRHGMSRHEWCQFRKFRNFQDDHGHRKRGASQGRAHLANLGPLLGWRPLPLRRSFRPSLFFRKRCGSSRSATATGSLSSTSPLRFDRLLAAEEWQTHMEPGRDPFFHQPGVLLELPVVVCVPLFPREHMTAGGRSVFR